MKTVDILFAKYRDKLVPLTTVAADYYAVTDLRTINRMAARGEFPHLRPFKMRDSRDAVYFVDIDNLADAIERRGAAAS